LIGLNAVVGGRTRNTAWSELVRTAGKGCYDVHARMMTWTSTASRSMCFGNSLGFDGRLSTRRLIRAGLRHLQAYNDWHYDEWCMKYPGRFIPLGILPTWGHGRPVAEIHRFRKGLSHHLDEQNPTVQGLPSIHNEYWGPFFKAWPTRT